MSRPMKPMKQCMCREVEGPEFMVCDGFIEQCAEERGGCAVAIIDLRHYKLLQAIAAEAYEEAHLMPDCLQSLKGPANRLMDFLIEMHDGKATAALAELEVEGDEDG